MSSSYSKSSSQSYAKTSSDPQGNDKNKSATTTAQNPSFRRLLPNPASRPPSHSGSQMTGGKVSQQNVRNNGYGSGLSSTQAHRPVPTGARRREAAQSDSESDGERNANNWASTNAIHPPSSIPPTSYKESYRPEYTRKHKKDHSQGITNDERQKISTRLDKIESAIGTYMDNRGKEALNKSVLPGQKYDESENAKYFPF